VNLAESIGGDLLTAAGRKAADLHAAIDRELKPVSMALPGSTASIRIGLTSTRKATTYNVVGLLEGSDSKLKDETIVISAHYDHDGPAGDGAIYPGADDNGSGTVGVVALAHAFAKSGIRPKRSILFAVFAAEERGLLGSYYYVAHPLRLLSGTRAVINFDMIGRDEKDSTQTNGLINIEADTSNEMNLVGTYYSPEYTAIVERCNKKVGLALNYKWDEEAALNVFFRSDQYPFVLRGIPAMWWFTGFHPDYHQTTDTVEKINFGKMVKILELAFHAAEEFGNSSKPPAFVPVTKK
jgi:Zn-dependent M28 family amino/carboxypeptidase